MKLLGFLALVAALYFLYRKLFGPKPAAPDRQEPREPRPVAPQTPAPSTTSAPETPAAPFIAPSLSDDSAPFVFAAPIEELKTLSRQQARVMRTHDVATIADLATASKQQLQTLSQQLETGHTQLQAWREAALLMHQQPAIDAGHALLLQSIGCRDLEQLQSYPPEQLQSLLSARNSQQRHVRVLATSDTIKRWQSA